MAGTLALDGIPGEGAPGLFTPGVPELSAPAPPPPAAQLGGRVTILPSGASPLQTGVQGAVTSTNAVIPWTLTMPAGTLAEYTFTFDQLNVATGFYVPLPITGTTWEYVVRATPTSGGSPLIEVTTTEGAAGVITVTATAVLSQLLLAVFPAATATLAPGLYSHAMWQDPGTASAFCWMTGGLLVAGTPQP